MGVHLLAQSGNDFFLVDAGIGSVWGLENVRLARVYDRREHRLHAAAPLESILARGYWDNVHGDVDLRSRVRAEVAGLLPA